MICNAKVNTFAKTVENVLKINNGDRGGKRIKTMNYQAFLLETYDKILPVTY